MISVCVIYVFIVVLLILSPRLFFAVMSVILLVYFIKPSLLTEVAEEVFTNLTWTLLAILILLIIVAAIAGSKVKSMLEKNGGTEVIMRKWMM